MFSITLINSYAIKDYINNLFRVPFIWYDAYYIKKHKLKPSSDLPKINSTVSEQRPCSGTTSNSSILIRKVEKCCPLKDRKAKPRTVNNGIFPATGGCFVGSRHLGIYFFARITLDAFWWIKIHFQMHDRTIQRNDFWLLLIFQTFSSELNVL